MGLCSVKEGVTVQGAVWFAVTAGGGVPPGGRSPLGRDGLRIATTDIAQGRAGGIASKITDGSTHDLLSALAHGIDPIEAAVTIHISGEHDGIA